MLYNNVTISSSWRTRVNTAISTRYKGRCRWPIIIDKDGEKQLDRKEIHGTASSSSSSHIYQIFSSFFSVLIILRIPLLAFFTFLCKGNKSMWFHYSNFVKTDQLRKRTSTKWSIGAFSHWLFRTNLSNELIKIFSNYREPSFVHLSTSRVAVLDKTRKDIKGFILTAFSASVI